LENRAESLPFLFIRTRTSRSVNRAFTIVFFERDAITMALVTNTKTIVRFYQVNRSRRAQSVADSFPSFDRRDDGYSFMTVVHAGAKCVARYNVCLLRFSDRKTTSAVDQVPTRSPRNQYVYNIFHVVTKSLG